MYALASFDGSQHSEDHQPGTMDQLTHLQRRRQVTLQEDFVQVNGKPEELCSIRHDTEQQALAVVEHRVDQIVASTRYEFEHAAALMEQKLQLRLEESFRASHATAQSTLRDAVQAISVRVDSAEANLVEARARLDEALDIHVANSQLIAPENIRQQIAEICDEGVHEALRSAQASFNAAVEEKAERHASLIEQRLWERVDDTHRQAQNAMTSQIRASEAQMQARLEALLAAASSHTDSSVTSLESKLGKKTIELCSTLERSMSKKVSASVKSLEKKVNDRLDAAKVQILGEAHSQVLAAVAQMETQVSSLQHLVKAQQPGEADKDEVKEALAAQMERVHLSQKLSAEGLDDRIQRAIRDLEVRVEGTTRKQVNEALSTGLQTIEQKLSVFESCLLTQRTHPTNCMCCSTTSARDASVEATCAGVHCTTHGYGACRSVPAPVRLSDNELDGNAEGGDWSRFNGNNNKGGCWIKAAGSQKASGKSCRRRRRPEVPQLKVMTPKESPLERARMIAQTAVSDRVAARIRELKSKVVR